MKFTSGQKLTALNLNNLVNLAEGQNIPTDQQFIKSTGTNVWTAPASRPLAVKNHKIFDVQVRYHDINDSGQLKGEDYTPDYKPFWYVYLGSDRVKLTNNIARWDLKIEAGSSSFLAAPMWIFTQPLPLEGSIEDYEFKDAIVEMTYYDASDEAVAYKPFYAGKFFNNLPQLINSDQNGWFCTGLPAFNFPKDDTEYTSSELYATFIRSNTQIASIQGSTYFTALVFSNQPILGLGTIKRNSGYEVQLPSMQGVKFQYAELMGGHSQKIGSYRMTAVLGEGYGVENTSIVPSDSLNKKVGAWEIVTPTILDPDDNKAGRQLHNYEMVYCNYVDPAGNLILPFFGNTDDLTELKNLNIYFSDFSDVDKPTGNANVYYVELIYNNVLEDDEDDQVNFEIHRIKEFSGSITDARNALDTLSKLATVAIEKKNYDDNNKKYHMLVSIFILNTNGKIDIAPFGEMIPWSIEFVAYINRLPDFSKFIKYDSNLASAYDELKPQYQSIQRDRVPYKNEDGEEISVIVDQLFQFSDEDYKLDSTAGLSAEILIRRHGEIEGKETHRLEYLDLSAFSTSTYYGDADIEMTGQKSIETLSVDDHILGLYDFENPTIDTVHTNILNAGEAYDLLNATADSVLVRDGTTKTLKYKRLTIESNVGGGTTSGYTGTQTLATSISWDETDHKIKLLGSDFRYENGLLKAVGATKVIAEIDAVEHIAHDGN